MDGDAPLLRYTEETHAPAHVDTSTVAGATFKAEQDAKLKAANAARSAANWRVGLSWGTKILLAVGLMLAFKAGWLGKAWAFARRFF